MDQLSIPEVIPRVPQTPLQAPHTDAAPHISQDPTNTPKLITADRLDTLLQMQRTDPFCKCISRRLLNAKAPHHEFDTFTHVKGLLYKHITDAGKKIPCTGFPQIMEVHHSGRSP